jgi:ATP-dependent RNA helicase DDX41
VLLAAGRKGKTGIATTFINKNQSEHILLDLKHLLKEAKQRIPPVLQALHDPMEELAVGGGGPRGLWGRPAPEGGWLW